MPNKIITPDMELVRVMVAEARNEQLDSKIRSDATAAINELASDPNPHNRYKIGQVIAYSVTELQKDAMPF